MRKKPVVIAKRTGAPLYKRIREILESAQASASRSVNTTHVVANWLIGREIVEEEQKGRKRADYGKRLLESLAERLREDYGPSYSLRNLRFIRQFYIEYPDPVPPDGVQSDPKFSTHCVEILDRITEIAPPAKDDDPQITQMTQMKDNRKDRRNSDEAKQGPAARTNCKICICGEDA